MKKILTVTTIALLAFSNNASANWDKPTLVYGGGLSVSQKAEVNRLLKVNSEDISEQTTRAVDVEKYLNVKGTSDSTLFSSTLVSKTNKTGVNVDIKTPENITKITEKQYANAAITAGAKNVNIEVVSPIKVTGESALTGVYIALESNGEQLDKERTKVAQKELETVNEIAVVNKDKADFNPEKLDVAVTEIKTELAKHAGEATEQTVKDIVNTSLENNGLSEIVTPEQVDKLVAFAKAYQQTDAINSEEVAQQLNAFKEDALKNIQDISKNVSEKTDGFLDKISAFFESLWKAISNIFA